MTGDMATVSPENSADGNTGVLELCLYIVRGARNSNHALANLTALLKEHFEGSYRLEVVDMLQDPQRARADGILLTPTLIKLSPVPRSYIIGDLSQTGRVLQSLMGS